MKKIIFVFYLLAGFYASAQECKNCGKPTVTMMTTIEPFDIQKPQDSLLLKEWNKLNDLSWTIYQRLADHFSEIDPCTYIFHTSSENLVSDIKRSGYVISGIISQKGKDYQLEIWLQTACSMETLAKTEVLFQLYPVMDLENIAAQAVAQFIPLIDIPEFELQKRQSKHLPIAETGNLEMQILNRAVKPGSETEVLLFFRDCDGKYLKNKEISFEGTTGGTFTPSTVVTNADGGATAKFNLTSSTKAILRAKTVTKNVKGCDVVFTASEVLAPGPYVKVTITYDELEDASFDDKQANIFEAIKMTGGIRSEVKTMVHVLEFFHKPSPEALKKGFLVFDEKTEIENFGSTSDYTSDIGYASYSKNVEQGEMGVEVSTIEIKENQQGSEESYSAAAPERAATIQLFMGDAQNPAYFIMNIEYPLSDTYIAQAATTIVKGDKLTGSFVTEKITDPKSAYKTEYTLTSYKNLHTEFIEGQNNIGINLKKVGGVKGYKIVNVSILSPY